MSAPVLENIPILVPEGASSGIVRTAQEIRDMIYEIEILHPVSIDQFLGTLLHLIPPEQYILLPKRAAEELGL